LSQSATDLESSVLDSQNRTSLVLISPKKGGERPRVIRCLRFDVKEKVEQRDLVEVDSAH
jgi:hypothetical protein